jgi:purine-binding chemotaxis protein CheW
MALALKTRGGRNTLAGPPQERKAQYLAFTLGGEAYAMEIRAVKEVIQFGGLTPVPLLPDFIRGVINLRGEVVPVVDLSVRFGRAPADAGRRTCIVVLEVEGLAGLQELGIVVDTVSEVLELGERDIEPAPAFGGGPRTAFLAGVAKVGKGFVILLDEKHLLSTDEMAALAASVPEEPEGAC